MTELSENSCNKNEASGKSFWSVSLRTPPTWFLTRGWYQSDLSVCPWNQIYQYENWSTDSLKWAIVLVVANEKCFVSPRVRTWPKNNDNVSASPINDDSQRAIDSQISEIMSRPLADFISASWCFQRRSRLPQADSFSNILRANENFCSRVHYNDKRGYSRIIFSTLLGVAAIKNQSLQDAQFCVTKD